MAQALGNRQDYIRMTDLEKALGMHRATLNKKLAEHGIIKYAGLDRREQLVPRSAITELARIEPRPVEDRRAARVAA